MDDLLIHSFDNLLQNNNYIQRIAGQLVSSVHLLVTERRRNAILQRQVVLLTQAIDSEFDQPSDDVAPNSKKNVSSHKQPISKSSLALNEVNILNSKNRAQNARPKDDSSDFAWNYRDLQIFEVGNENKIDVGNTDKLNIRMEYSVRRLPKVFNLSGLNLTPNSINSFTYNPNACIWLFN